MFKIKGLNDIVRNPDGKSHTIQIRLAGTNPVRSFSVYAGISFNHGFIFPKHIRVKPGVMLRVKDNTLLLNREIQ